MPTVKRVGGETVLELTKAEVRQILEATYVSEMVARNFPGCEDAEEFMVVGRKLAKTFGRRHLTEGGELAPTVSEARRFQQDQQPLPGVDKPT